MNVKTFLSIVEYGNFSDTAYQKLVECGVEPRQGIDVIFDILSQEGQCNFIEPSAVQLS